MTGTIAPPDKCPACGFAGRKSATSGQVFKEYQRCDRCGVVWLEHEIRKNRERVAELETENTTLRDQLTKVTQERDVYHRIRDAMYAALRVACSAQPPNCPCEGCTFRRKQVDRDEPRSEQV